MRLVRSLLLLTLGLATAAVPATLVARPSVAVAADPALNTQQIISAVELAYKDVSTIQADFTQTVSSPTLGEQVQKGRLQLKRPQKARWEFTEPRPSAMITNGRTMWVWSPADNQVIVSQDLSTSSGGGGSSDLMTLLTDMRQVETLFTVEQVPSAPAGSHVLRLTPRDATLQQQLRSLELTLATGTMALQKLTLVDAFGNTTRLDFAAVRLNPDLPDGRFSFEVPAGATVIDAGGL